MLHKFLLLTNKAIFSLKDFTISMSMREAYIVVVELNIALLE
jgi:hypothetical protein